MANKVITLDEREVNRICWLAKMGRPVHWQYQIPAASLNRVEHCLKDREITYYKSVDGAVATIGGLGKLTPRQAVAVSNVPAIAGMED